MTLEHVTERLKWFKMSRTTLWLVSSLIREEIHECAPLARY
jgi:hypothetical protein